ncbi:Rieske (2Fe-2S) protein [Natrinema salifodinae]|uniref:Rieske [2Fe-2S] domain-containing protein n=1 Tax=Natrinema salifodinae TaxID=1202768 RepID=A0A1I0Q5T2_9EURY|nr:Rieske 2Fe-2S domain-containing protein [Natrinema salifodinae]SEW22183.1 Rieske [2Fe-2S] domain-containing protein [Natrinema salifodinae]
MDAADAGRIAALPDVPTDSTFLFRVTDESDEEREAILVRTAPADGGEPTTGDGDGFDGDGESDGDEAGPAEIACWLNYCQHLTHIKLDKGSGAPMRNGELVCANHGAYFEAESGRCTFGPCEGAYLTDLEVTVSDGDVYLVDDEFEFVGPGPIERDDLDRASSSNVEF